jgi:hypothetical protein
MDELRIIGTSWDQLLGYCGDVFALVNISIMVFVFFHLILFTAVDK